MANNNISPPPSPYVPAFVGPPRPGRVLGASITAPVRRYTPPPAPIEAPVPVAPPVPTPDPTQTASVPQAPVVPTPAMDLIQPPALQPVDETSIREQMRKNSQAQIDAINANYGDLISQEQNAGQDRSGQTRAINARSGTIGSDFGSAQEQKTGDFNKQQIKSLQDEQSVKIGAVTQNIEDRASQAIRDARSAATDKYNVDSKAYEAAQTQAKADLTALAGAGVNLDKQLSPQQKAALLKQAGYSSPDIAQLAYNSMKTAATRIDYKVEKLDNGKALFYGQDPQTGELKTLNVDLNIPQGYSPTMIGGQMYYKNDQTGDLTPAPLDDKLQTTDYKNYMLSKNQGGFKGTFEQWLTQDANRKHTVNNTTINTAPTVTEKEYNLAKDQGFNGSFLDYQKKVYDINHPTDRSL